MFFMTRRVAIVERALLLLAITGCGKPAIVAQHKSQEPDHQSAAANGTRGAGSASTGCPPFQLTVNGKPVAAPRYSIAFSSDNLDDRLWQAELFPRPITCEQRLGGAPIKQDLGGIVGAYIGGYGLSVGTQFTMSKGSAGDVENGVAYGDHQYLSGTVSIIGDPPKGPGGILGLCVGPTEFEAPASEQTGQPARRISMRGRIAGPYCGEFRAFNKPDFKDSNSR